MIRRAAEVGRKGMFGGRLRRAPLVLLLLAVATPLVPREAAAISGTISTVAGNGIAGYSGEGQATSVSLNYPYALVLDSAGNLYIADRNNNRVRKVDSSGTISTVAGNGTAGYSGDGGPATSASLNNPYGVAVDLAGNVYIADTYNNRVRKVSTAGTISTVAGNGTGGYSGDGGPATSASLNAPYGVSVNPVGILYVVDTLNSRVRKVSATGTISTVAGNGTVAYSGDGGPATSASLAYPMGVTFDSAGNLYIADTYNQRVRKVTTSGTISTVAGNGTAAYSGDLGPATSASLNSPHGVAIDSVGNLYITDSNNNRLRMVTQGIISTVAGDGTAGYSGDGGPPAIAQLNYPHEVAVDSGANVYFTDLGNQRVRKIDGAPSAPSKPIVTLDPTVQTRATGQTAALTATVHDGRGVAMSGATVTFTRSGANGSPPAVNLTTDASGRAVYNYVGSSVGDDTVTASTAGSIASASAVVHWTTNSATFPSDDCDAGGTNVVTGFLDGAFVKAKTAPGGVNTTWVCVAAEAAGQHGGGKLSLNATGPGLSVAQVDLDAASISACGSNANNIRVGSGLIAGQPWWVDVTPSPSGSTDSAWVCVRMTNSVGFRLRFAPGVSIGVPSFALDPTSAHVPAYIENPWPAPAQPSATCQLAGGTRVANLTVGTTPVALYSWEESLSKTHLCVRAGSTGATGAHIEVDAGAFSTGISTTNDTSPCPFALFTSDDPSFGVYTSDPSASLPAAACVAIGTTARGVVVNAPSVGSVVTFQQDTA